MYVSVRDERRLQPLIARLLDERAISRLFRRDASLFAPEGTPEVADRLGWLDLPAALPATVDALRRRLPGGGRVWLAGMGGSSLAAEVFWRCAGRSGHHVLDTTHPAAVRRAVDGVREGDLVIAASKSGTTVETRTMLDILYDRHRDRARFRTITDPGSPLEQWAQQQDVPSIAAPPDVGGRFSALSVFGLAPAIAAGIDPMRWKPVLSDLVELCRTDSADNPAIVLAAALAAAWDRGSDLLLLRDAPGLPLFPWIEQLIAESLGKTGIGLIPLPATGRTTPDTPAELCRLRLGTPSGGNDADIVVRLDSFAELAAVMFLFEVATALTGHLLGVQPFDQPDVERAKVLARDALRGDLPQLDREPARLLSDWLDAVPASHVVVIQAFVDPPDLPQIDEFARNIATRHRRVVHAAAGPRYLHASGQLHKARPQRFSFLNLVDAPQTDIAIPGARFTMGRLLRAQADADVLALREKGARVFAATWPDVRAAPPMRNDGA